MLRAITISGSAVILNIDSDEYALDGLPPHLLTAAELGEVRAIRPGALPGYAVKTEDDDA